MGKESKKSKKSSDKKADAMIVDSVAEITPAVNYLQTVIAHPLASSKLTKKLLKTVKKAAQDKKVRRGVKEVSKGLRKGEKGIVIIAGNISPIDVISHLPVLCEDHDIQYVFVPSKEDLGTAGSTKRPTSVVLISDKCEGGAQESLVECKSEMKKLAYVNVSDQTEPTTIATTMLKADLQAQLETSLASAHALAASWLGCDGGGFSQLATGAQSALPSRPARLGLGADPTVIDRQTPSSTAILEEKQLRNRLLGSNKSKAHKRKQNEFEDAAQSISTKRIPQPSKPPQNNSDDETESKVRSFSRPKVASMTKY